MYADGFYSEEYKQQRAENQAIANTEATVQTEKPQFATQEDYKKACETFPYTEISRNPELYRGKLAQYTGQVVQVMENYGTTMIRMNVNEDEFGIWNDTIYAEIKYDNSSNGRILENDIITVYGEMNGIKTYTSVMGYEVSIPFLNAQYVTIN